MLLLPVWTGKSDERWGAVVVRTGTTGNIVSPLSQLSALYMFLNHSISVDEEETVIFDEQSCYPTKLGLDDMI